MGQQGQRQLNNLIEIILAAGFIIAYLEFLNEAVFQESLQYPFVQGESKNKSFLAQYQLDAFQQLDRLRGIAPVQVIDKDGDLGGFDFGIDLPG